jgi:hypothetical protein
VTSGSSSRCAFGRDTNNVSTTLNSKTSAAWIPPSAIKRDAFTTHHNNYNNSSTTYNTNHSYSKLSQAPAQECETQLQIDQDDQETFRKARGILNKLTPEKFEKLSVEFCYLKIRNPKVLRGIIVLVTF